MNPHFDTVLASSPEDLNDLFVTTGNSLGTVAQNVEKDFWVCWTLDGLFNGATTPGPRLLFKGGTSLSKGYGLIERFSEDIDITVFREDIGQAASVEDLEALSGKKRKIRLDEILAACQEYIHGSLLPELNGRFVAALNEAGISDGNARLEPDPDDADGQSLLLWYPSVTARGNDYIRRAIKIESGAKSALDPHSPIIIKPYVNDQLSGLDLSVPNVTTVDPRRTLWDKIVILHGLRRWWDHRQELKGGGQRVSRHYYDVYRLLQSEAGQEAVNDRELAKDCVRHAQMFFNRPNFDLADAVPGTFTLSPHEGMVNDLQADYQAMSGMIFGDVPPVQDVLASIATLEGALNHQP